MRSKAYEVHEECGVIGVVRADGPAAELVHRGLFALQHRGQEAAGIVTWGPTKELHHLKGRGLVSECLPVYQVKALAGSVAIGHVRYSTVTMDRSENIQPFLATTPYGKFAIGHNGNLKNTDALRSRLEAAGSLLSTTMDTELIVHLLARSGAKSFVDALARAAGESLGAYSLVMICEGVLYALRDPHGIRPLVLGELKAGWVVASETCALDALGATYVRDLGPGELLTIENNRLTSRQLLPVGRPAPCVFELVYFSRPDSRVFGQGVHGARTRMGERLAMQDLALGTPMPDVIVPVPDSGFPAAVGYARQSGVALEKAIIRSHYVGRTFILPDQDSRSHSIRLKLSVIREAVCDKRVLLIDDSIVRGNTSREIVAMVRSAGAREVGMRIASPPLAWPCYLGIDTPDRDELVINQHRDEEGVRRFIGCDSLRYLTIDGLAEATGRQPFCMGCMNGDYPL
ncbi:MAG: amidophosphoribosyltransferase [Deltaproteobacteria bacterium]|nr:amidophosphoribosyltransferase [Deltaproteobacteria bacterium]